MHITDGCFDCLLSRIGFECRLVCKDDERVNYAVHACTDLLTEIQHEDYPSPVIASRIHRLAYSIIGDADPYYNLKQENNHEALSLCSGLGNNFSCFRDFCLAAIIGNTLDYGSKEHTVTKNFEEFFYREFEKGLTIDHTEEIEKRCSRVVYLCDNCGEIVFDRLLIEHLKAKGAHVTVVVRGGPILNDATMEDAIALGLDSAADALLTNSCGIAELGLNLDIIPQQLSDALDKCSLIIAKGMANYESLSEYKDLPPVAHLMSVKCDPIARNVGAPKGSRIALLVE